MISTHVYFAVDDVVVADDVVVDDVVVDVDINDDFNYCC